MYARRGRPHYTVIVVMSKPDFTFQPEDELMLSTRIAAGKGLKLPGSGPHPRFKLQKATVWKRLQLSQAGSSPRKVELSPEVKDAVSDKTGGF